MLGITRSILGTVGNTPAVRIDCIAPAGIELFGRRETNSVAFDRSGNDDAHSFFAEAAASTK